MPDFPNLDGRVVAFDYETTGVSWVRDRAFALAIAYYDEERGEFKSNCYDLSHPQHLRYVRECLRNVAGLYAHWARFEAHFSRKHEIAIPKDRLMCTMIREALLDENKYTYSLDDLSFKYLQNEDGSAMQKLNIWPELAAMFGGKPTKEAQIGNLVNAPWELTSKYACKDAELCLRVAACQDIFLEDEDLWRVHDLEMQLLQVVIEMERGGVRVDIGRAEEAYEQLTVMIDREQRELDRLVGRAVNANSPPQAKQILKVHQRDDGEWYTGDGLKLEKTAPSKTHPDGQPSLDSIKMHQCKLPEAEHIINIRGYLKARDTFIKQYMLEMNHNGYVHASINQTRTEDGAGVYTGRFSITEPALQQIHKRNKAMAAIVRACFVPDVGDEWWCYDWAQMDFRIFASYLNDPRITSIYAKDPNADFHQMVANLTGLPRDRDQKTGGGNAKQVNLAMVFSMGAGELAKQCNLPYTKHQKGYLLPGPEAKAMFAKYHAAIPGVMKLRRSVESVAKSRGYIHTQLGRRLRFPGGMGAYKAAGLLYQATAADAMKIKLVALYKLLEEEPEVRARLMITVHDEFGISTPKETGRESGLHDRIRLLLQQFDGRDVAMKLRVPIRADFGYGPNWHEASK